MEYKLIALLITVISLSGCAGSLSQYPSNSVADAVVASCDSGVVSEVQRVERAIDNSLIIYAAKARIRSVVQSRGDYDIRLNLSSAIKIDCPEKPDGRQTH